MAWAIGWLEVIDCGCVRALGEEAMWSEPWQMVLLKGLDVGISARRGALFVGDCPCVGVLTDGKKMGFEWIFAFAQRTDELSTRINCHAGYMRARLLIGETISSNFKDPVGDFAMTLTKAACISNAAPAESSHRNVKDENIAYVLTDIGLLAG